MELLPCFKYYQCSYGSNGTRRTRVLTICYDKIPIQYKELGTNINSIVWSFLHELGHIECGHTADRQKAKRWFANLLSKIDSKITQKWASDIYFNLEEEQEATKWAVRFAILHYQEVKEFEKKLIKKYKKFYNRILTKET